MTSLPRPYFTPEEYLALERRADYRSEYFEGEIFAMAGATREHNLIGINVGAELRAHLKGRPCETYVADMRVKISDTGLYTYPDVVVACGDLQFEDEKLDTLLNPTVIIEVLSTTTEAYDRGAKFGHYRRIPSVQAYVMVSQERYLIEHYARAPGGRWILTAVESRDESIDIPSLDARLSLAEVYDRVVIRPPNESDVASMDLP